MKNFFKNIIIAFLVFLAIASFFAMWQTPLNRPEEITLSELARQINQEQVNKIQVEGNDLKIELKDNKVKKAKKETESALSESFKNYNVNPEKLAKVEIKIQEKSGLSYWLSNILPFLIPFVLIAVFIYFMTRSVQRQNIKAMMFGESRARKYEAKGKQRITFRDVAGIKEAKEELWEVVEFLKSPQKFQALGAQIPKGVLLVGPPGTGKCITGESFVLTNKGLIKIKNIPKYFYVDDNSKVYGAKIITCPPDKRKNVVVSASHWYNLGKQKTLKIKTQLGYGIEGTYEHPIVILDRDGNFKFRRLDKIKNGDKVVIKYNTQIFGKENRIPDGKTAYLLGLLVGDGCLTIKNRIYFSTANSDILKFVKNYFKKRFNYSLKKATSKYDWVVCDKGISNKFIDEYGLLPCYAENKTIPEWILMSPKPIIKAFLQGLFDTDAYTDRKRGTVQYSTASGKLLKEVGCLLLNFGVVCKVYSRPKKYNNKLQFYLEISGDFLEKFRQEISYNLVFEKQKLLENYLKNKNRNTNINLVFYQHQRIKRIWEFLKARKIQISLKFGENIHKNILRYIDTTRQPSLTALRNFLIKVKEFCSSSVSLPEFQYIKSIVFSGFFFSPVVSIKKGEDVVYDFTVPKHHSFVANGMISHNTLLAKAVAGEANVPFFSISGSEFVEMFVGVGASRVRSLFQNAKRNAPDIIFMDEIDAVGRQRGAGLGGSHDEREQTLNQILTEMDGFEPNAGVIILAATNRPDVLDPALLRPGRFDRRVILQLPDIKEREQILKIHSQGKPFAVDISLKKLALRTPGFSGADLKNLMNEAAILAARKNKKKISMQDCFDSIEKVLLGPERKSFVMSEDEKKIAAYHEAGHALCAHLLPHTDPVQKVSIVSRGFAAGYTLKLPEKEKHFIAKLEFLDDLAVFLAGYAAEKKIFGDVTTGATSDLREATKLARKLVTEYGMSEKLGPMTFGQKEELIFLGREISEQRDYSEEIAQKIDQEVHNFIDLAYKKASEVIDKNKEKLEKIAKALIENEGLEKEDFEKIVGPKSKQQDNKITK